MSFKKHKGSEGGDKPFKSKGKGFKDKPFAKEGARKPYKTDKSGADKGSKSGIRTSKNSEYNVFDKDELAPPRFLAKRSDSPYGAKKRDDRKPYSKSRPDFDKKNSDGSFGDNKRGDRKPYGKSRPDFDKKSNDGSFGDSKRGDRKPFSRSKPDFDKKGRDGGFGQKSREDRKPYSKSRPEFDKRESGKSFKERESNGTKKPFRPKYDPEVKIRKSYRERKEALTGGPSKETDDIRLNKYLANSGICSRREADELISQGLVSVNGNIVTEMGYKVKKEDVVKYDGRKIMPEPYVYILMNKPKDFITTTDDEKGRKTVMDLLADKIPQRVFPIGRLDRNTTGVLLLTNDGEVTQALTHPSFEIKKVYHVVLDKKVSGNELDKLVSGVELEDGTVFADAATFVDNEDRRHVGVEIHSGRNRVVRRMFEALGFEVEKLDRVSMGIFTKKDLPRGKWRFLTQSEIGFLMKLKSKMN